MHQTHIPNMENEKWLTTIREEEKKNYSTTLKGFWTYIRHEIGEIKPPILYFWQVTLLSSHGSVFLCVHSRHILGLYDFGSSFKGKEKTEKYFSIFFSFFTLSKNKLSKYVRHGAGNNWLQTEKLQLCSWVFWNIFYIKYQGRLFQFTPNFIPFYMKRFRKRYFRKGLTFQSSEKSQYFRKTIIVLIYK